MRALCPFILVLFISWATLRINDVNSTVELSDQGQLNNLLVYVSDNVPERDGATLRDIKSVITEASKSLYKATKRIKNGQHGLSFGEVHVRVPKSWRVTAEPITWQQCVKSEFKITTKEMNGNSDKPFTKQLGDCGVAAEFSRFTDTFFSSSSKLKIKGRKMMREFVKLRYGVFSEKPLNNVLYYFNGSDFKQTSCPDNIKWKVNKSIGQCSDNNKVCKYEILRNQEHKYSVMFDDESLTSDYFCNDDTMPHNKRAKNLQNKKCKKRSITSVLLNHADFQKEYTTLGNAVPIFRIVKAMSRKIVLVIDTSGSMYDYAVTMKNALKHFINYNIENEAEVGIVTFNSEANILSGLVKIDENNKKELIRKIDTISVNGATNIGDGLFQACKVLGSNITSQDTVFGTIILLSDGESNENTTIGYPTAIDNIIQKGIVTYTISYGDIPDSHLHRLSNKTGGMFLFAPASSSESELLTKFAVQKSCDVSENRQVKAFEGTIKFKSEESLVNFTYIDKFVGKDTVIDVNFPTDVSKYVIKMVGPSGKKYDISKKSVNGKITILTFKINGKPTEGMHKLEIIPIVEKRYKRSTFSANLQFHVTSSQKGAHNPVGSVSTTLINMVNEATTVTITVDLSGIERYQFDDISVNMTMKYPDKSSVSWKMTDEGWGDDSIYGDGVYTRAIYARSFTEKGFYEFQGHVAMFDSTNGVSIQRTVDMESLRVLNIGNAEIADTVAPATIDRVTVISSNFANKTVTIEYTAPGDDSLTGNINQYDVRVKVANATWMMRVTETAFPFDIIQHQLKLKAMDKVEPFAVSVRGVDPSGNVGLWSEWTFVRWET